MFESQRLKAESQISGEAQGAKDKVRSTSPFPLPASPFRRGISLTEVLIAMGILTVGLLGVAAVFPVGGWYMQRAEIADRGSAIGQSVMSDIIARGMMNPSSWYLMVPNASPSSPGATSPNYFFSGIDGRYTPVSPTPQSPTVAQVGSTFTRPFSEALIAGLKVNTDPAILSKQFGSAFVIDPMFAAAAASTSANSNNGAAYAFPGTAVLHVLSSGAPYYANTSWAPWWAATANSKDRVWPIRRVTFQLPTGWPYDKAMAESVARAGDDLVSELPARDDRPASQKWDVDTNSGAPLARQWTGDYSWIATVTPPTNAARNGMAHNPEGFDYDVSVVVFYKRALPSAVPTTNTEMSDAASHERMVSAKIISTGTSGGQLLLTDMNDVFDTSSPPKSITPFNQLKTGQWIMLCGPHPNSSTSEPKFVLNWYQVLSIEGANTRLNTYGTETPAPATTDPDRRLITVRGTQWPWQPSNNTGYVAGPTTISDDLCVGIFKGAVAVHSKTMRLESSVGSSFGSGMTIFTPPGVTNGNTAF